MLGECTSKSVLLLITVASTSLYPDAGCVLPGSTWICGGIARTLNVW